MASSKVYHILLVEDEASLKELYRELLFSEGFEVEVVEDGESALAKMRQGGYDLVLLDIRMPRMDGLHVLKSLTPEEKEQNGKIYMLTQFDNDDSIKEAYELGASGYLMKSALTPAEVLHEVEAALGE